MLETVEMKTKFLALALFALLPSLANAESLLTLCSVPPLSAVP